MKTYNKSLQAMFGPLPVFASEKNGHRFKRTGVRVKWGQVLHRASSSKRQDLNLELAYEASIWLHN